VVATPLAVEAAEKLPHVALPQVTVHLTPPLLLSLLTTAVRLAVVAVTSDVGAAELKFTEMAGGVVVAGGVLDPPPHPAMTKQKMTKQSTREESLLAVTFLLFQVFNGFIWMGLARRT
jgi:hypothetical protein